MVISESNRQFSALQFERSWGWHACSLCYANVTVDSVSSMYRALQSMVVTPYNSNIFIIMIEKYERSNWH